MTWFFCALLLFLSWLYPMHVLPWVSWHGEVPAFFAAILLAWASLRAMHQRRDGMAIGVPLLALPFLLLGVVVLAQVSAGVMTFWGDAVVVWFYLAVAVVCLLLGFNAGAMGSASAPGIEGPRNWPPATLVALTLMTGALASAVVAFAQVFDLWEHATWISRMPDLRRPGGNLGQPNQLATLLIMGIASTAFLYLERKLTASIALLGLLVLCVGLAATESRTGVLALAVLLAWWQLKRQEVAPQVSRWAAPVLGGLFVAIFAGWPRLLHAMQLLDGPAATRLGNGDIRLTVWTQLVQAALQHPWVGWGVTEVAEAHNAVAHLGPTSNPVSYSHNLVLDWAVWMGVPIALGLVLVSGIWLWRRIKANHRPATWYCLAVLIPLFTHSMLEFPFAYSYFLVPTLFLAGLLEGMRGEKAALRMRVRPAAVMLLGLSAALLWSVVEYLQAEEDFRIVRFEQLNIGRTQQDYERPQIRLLTQLDALLVGSRIELRSGMQPDEIEQLRKLALRYPWIATQYRYALALAMNGNRPEANRQLQVIRGQQGEKFYVRIRKDIGELSGGRYPGLTGWVLP